jgi:hypothetical protein
MNDESRQAHWEKVYTSKSENEVSWFQENSALSHLPKPNARIGRKRNGSFWAMRSDSGRSTGTRQTAQFDPTRPFVARVDPD